MTVTKLMQQLSIRQNVHRWKIKKKVDFYQYQKYWLNRKKTIKRSQNLEIQRCISKSLSLCCIVLHIFKKNVINKQLREKIMIYDDMKILRKMKENNKYSVTYTYLFEYISLHYYIKIYAIN